MSLVQAGNEITRESLKSESCFSCGFLVIHWGFMSVCACLCGDRTFRCFADLSSLDLYVKYKHLNISDFIYLNTYIAKMSSLTI